MLLLIEKGDLHYRFIFIIREIKTENSNLVKLVVVGKVENKKNTGRSVGDGHNFQQFASS